MAKLTIDGAEVEVEDGLNLIQAAAQLGIEIPHFCYHPALSIVSQCRQCLVEVEGVPKVMPACNTFVRNDLVVKTRSEKALKAREAAVEFTLINHPLDCPICDKGGECPLQLTTFSHGPGGSRFDGPEEKKVRKKYLLSDQIAYDPNRCIMCTRCVRFTDEVTETGELGYSGRGFRKKIVTFPGIDLDNELSGNVIDLCPVGALLSTETLHEERVWYYKFTDSVCSLCSTGCNITVGTDPRKGKISRIRPRSNPEVNDFWICDRGRWGFRDVQENNRIKQSMKRSEQGLTPCSFDEAIETAFIALSEPDPQDVAIIGSGLLTNEEAFLLKRLANQLGVDNYGAHTGSLHGEKKFGLISTDPYPNSTGVHDSRFARDRSFFNVAVRDLLEGRLKTLLTVGLDLFNIVPENKTEELQKAIENIENLVVIDFKLNRTAGNATVLLPGASPYEKNGTYTNDQGRVQALRQAIEPPGGASQDWEIITLLGRKANSSVFPFTSPGKVLDHISGQNPAYSGMSLDRIGVLGTAKPA